FPVAALSERSDRAATSRPSGEGRMRPCCRSPRAPVVRRRPGTRSGRRGAGGAPPGGAVRLPRWGRGGPGRRVRGAVYSRGRPEASYVSYVSESVPVPFLSLMEPRVPQPALAAPAAASRADVRFRDHRVRPGAAQRADLAAVRAVRAGPRDGGADRRLRPAGHPRGAAARPGPGDVGVLARGGVLPDLRLPADAGGRRDEAGGVRPRARTGPGAG